MRMSDEGIAMLVEFEGEILRVYKDPVGLPTFGVGHLVTPAEKKDFPVGKKITKAVSRQYLRQDLQRFEQCVTTSVRVPITQNQFDALVSLAFNIGESAFKKSSVLRHLNNRRYEDAADAFLLWNKGTVNGKRRVLEGLVRRRATERSVFLTKDSATTSQQTNTEAKDTLSPASLTKPANDPDIAADSLPNTLWARLMSWWNSSPLQTKVDQAVTFRNSLSPISGSSKVTVMMAKLAGYPALIAGFFYDHWIWIIAGVALVGIAAFYLSRAKDHAAARVTAETQSQSQTVVVEK